MLRSTELHGNLTRALDNLPSYRIALHKAARCVLAPPLLITGLSQGKVNGGASVAGGDSAALARQNAGHGEGGGGSRGGGRGGGRGKSGDGGEGEDGSTFLPMTFRLAVHARSSQLCQRLKMALLRNADHRIRTAELQRSMEKARRAWAAEQVMEQ